MILVKIMFLAFEMDFDNELAVVIFDEVHYINDPDRGSMGTSHYVITTTRSAFNVVSYY